MFVRSASAERATKTSLHWQPSRAEWWCRPTHVFGELLAVSNAAKPSVLLLRWQQGRRAAQLAALLLANLGDVADDLAEGSIVVLDERRIRVRRLPLRPDT